MAEPKPFATLSSGLLARKGQARPAMRPGDLPALGGHDDLGWNDLGARSMPAATALAPPMVPEIVRRQAGLGAALELAGEAQAAVPTRAKAAFTLRLDAERHLRLRLACALGNRSAQRLVTEALDAFLRTVPDLDALAAQVPPRGPAPR